MKLKRRNFLQALLAAPLAAKKSDAEEQSEDKKIIVTEISKTCLSNPSQWEGTTDDHRYVYIRYRYGSLSVSISEPNGALDDAITGTEVFSHSSDTIDGYMSYGILKLVTKDILDLPDECKIPRVEPKGEFVGATSCNIGEVFYPPSLQDGWITEEE